MTKVRPPVSIENTLYRVLGELGIERACEATGRAPAYLRDATDPDKPQQLTVRDLVALDLACREAGDPTRPLWETVGLLLDAAEAERFAGAAAIGRLAAQLAKESGEATAAMIDAVLNPGCPATVDRAIRETEEAHDAATDAIASLREQHARHAGQPP